MAFNGGSVSVPGRSAPVYQHRYKVVIPLKVNRYASPSLEGNYIGIPQAQLNRAIANWNAMEAWFATHSIEDDVRETDINEFVDVFGYDEDAKIVSASWNPDNFGVTIIFDTNYTKGELRDYIAYTPLGDTVYEGVDNGWVISTKSGDTFAEISILENQVSVTDAPLGGRKKRNP